MKKLFTFVLSLACLSASAQLTISPTGLMDEIGMQAENMSPDMNYVAGMNQLSSQPAIWNVQTGDIKEFSFRDTIYQPIYGTKPGYEYIYDPVDFWVIIDSIPAEVEDYDVIVGYDSTLFEVNDYTGSFHAVNNAGIAVGAFGSGYGDKLPAFAHIADNEMSYLYINRELDEFGYPTEAGGDAYAINADGSIILGFYFDASWTVRACIWKNGGRTAADRIDLPAPTEEQMGCPIDYVATRWMSEDASVILGYAQDAYKGAWVMVHWTLEADGTYAVHADFAHQYFTTYDWVPELDANGNPVVDEWGNFNMIPSFINENPYVMFEPNAISANGEWVSVSMIERYDPMDSEAVETLLAGRINLKDNTLQVLPNNGEDAPIFYDIANNGTAVGATEAAETPGPLAPQKKVVKNVKMEGEAGEGRVGYVWPTVQHNIYSLQELYPNEEYFHPMLGEFTLSAISADASTVLGFSNKTDGVDSWVVSSFIAVLPELPAAIDNTEIKADVKKVFENGQVVIIRDGQRYSVTGVRL